MDGGHPLSPGAPFGGAGDMIGHAAFQDAAFSPLCTPRLGLLTGSPHFTSIGHPGGPHASPFSFVCSPLGPEIREAAPGSFGTHGKEVAAGLAALPDAAGRSVAPAAALACAQAGERAGGLPPLGQRFDLAPDPRYSLPLLPLLPPLQPSHPTQLTAGAAPPPGCPPPESGALWPRSKPLSSRALRAEAHQALAQEAPSFPPRGWAGAPRQREGGEGEGGSHRGGASQPSSSASGGESPSASSRGDEGAESSEGPAGGAADASASSSDSAGPGGGGAPGDGGGLTLEFLEGRGYFDMPIQAAAAALGVGVTTLKKVCRVHNIGRWPFRKRSSLARLISKTREYLADDPEQCREAVARLEAQRDSLRERQGDDIPDPIKRYRQSIFKLDYKVKRNARQQGGKGGKGGAKAAVGGRNAPRQLGAALPARATQVPAAPPTRSRGAAAGS